MPGTRPGMTNERFELAVLFFPSPTRGEGKRNASLILGTLSHDEGERGKSYFSETFSVLPGLFAGPATRT